MPDASDPLSLRLPPEVLADLERIAAATGRPASWVIARALRRYLATEGADILAVAAGQSDVAAGRIHEFDDVLAEIDAIVRPGKVA